MRRVRAASPALRGAVGEPHATRYATRCSTSSRAAARPRSAANRRASASGRRPTSPPATPGRSTTPTSSSCCPCSSSEPLPARRHDARGRRSRGGADARRDVRTPVPAARDARGRLRVGDAVRRLHPGRPGARPFPQVRRGRLRARRRGRAAHRRRVGAAPARHRASTCLLGSCTVSRTSGPARCGCSASSVLRALPPRRITPTGRRPACPPSRRI